MRKIKRKSEEKIIKALLNQRVDDKDNQSLLLQRLEEIYQESK